MRNNTENDIDQHITTLLTDILAPTNYAELRGVLKTIDLLTDYVRLENVRTMLEDDVLFRENRDVAVMALDILRKMHDNEQDRKYDACEDEVVDTVNEALVRAEPETIPPIKNVDEVVAVVEPETTPEPAEIEVTTVDATETQPKQVSRETQKIDTVIEIPVSSYAVPEESKVTDTGGDSADSIDSQTTELESVADGSGFPGLPDDDDDNDDGLYDSADSMDNETPELEPEPTSAGADFPGLPEDSAVTDTGGASADSIDIPTTELESVADGSGFPGLPDDDDGLHDSADSMDDEALGLGSKPASPVDFPGLSEDSDISAPADMAGSPFDDDPDQMPTFPDDGGDLSGLPEPAESKAGGELEHQWKQTVQRIKELKTRYVTK